MLKKSIILIMLFLLSSLVYAAFPHTVENLQPKITVVYNESVKVLDVNLTDTSGEVIPLSASPEYIPPTVYLRPYKPLEYIPTVYLQERDYVFNIRAEDMLHNIKGQTYYFTVYLPPISITLIAPLRGYSPVETYDVVIGTSRAVKSCRYSKASGKGDVSFPSMDYVFEKITDTRLKIKDFFGTETIYVKCEDIWGRINAQSTVFKLVYDPSPPQITSAYAEPSKILEEINGDLITTLYAVTNEETVCKYSDSAENYTNMDLDNKADTHDGVFEGNNESSGATFKKTNQRTLSSALGGRLKDGINSYNVSCMNRAGLFSQTELVAFEVDLSQELKITSNTPEATNQTTVLLNVSTNKVANCLYGEGADDVTLAFAQTGAYSHTKSLGPFAQGEYTYYVHCINPSSKKTADATITFLVDLRKPTKPIISAQNYTCPDDNNAYSVSASWTAEDNESGIGFYMFALGSASTRTDMKDWAQGTEQESLSNLNISGYTNLYWHVYAVDEAGNSGEAAVSSPVPVLSATSNKCATPGTCSDTQKNGFETDIDCGGTVCPKCAVGKECLMNSDCATGLCQYDSTSGKKVCMAVAVNHCNNNATDEDESDVDCGGDDCAGCEIGKKCGDNQDCKSIYCKNGICATATCNDLIKNGFETDVDCGGGKCPACENGKMCLEHSDCLSRRCYQEECAEPTCEDRLSDGDETDIDCGGTTCPSCGIGDSCLRDEDCLSDYCRNGICGDSATRDSDNDGMPDSWEDKYSCADLNKEDPSDASEDFDNDGLTNLEEYEYETDPCNPDTDGDGLSDGREVELGYDPTDPESRPKSPLLLIIIISVIVLALGGIGYFVVYPHLKQKYGKKAPRQRVLPQAPTARVLTLEEIAAQKAAHERYLQKMREKEIERKKMFEAFGKETKTEMPVKEQIISAFEKPKRRRERKQKEWLELDELLGKKKKSKKKSAFEKLAKISEKGKPKTYKKLEQVGKPKKEVYEKLEKIKPSKKPKIRKSKKPFKKLSKVHKKSRKSSIRELKKVAKK